MTGKIMQAVEYYTVEQWNGSDWVQVGPHLKDEQRVKVFLDNRDKPGRYRIHRITKALMFSYEPEARQ